MMKGDQAMLLRRYVLIRDLQEAGADKEVPDQLLEDLSDDELYKLAEKFNVDHPVVR
jgi:hypothetical protein